MEKKETTIGDFNYRLSRMPAYPDQFHVSRKLAPFIAKIGPVIQSAIAGGKTSDGDFLMAAFEPISEVLASMSVPDSEFLMQKCFNCIEREDSGRWQRAFTANGKPQYADIDLKTMMQLVVAVIRENFGDFFAAPPTTQQPGIPA